MVRRLVRIFSPRRPKSGPRWSMVALSMARRTLSGTLVGPGICRKCRPAWYCVMKPPSAGRQIGASPAACQSTRARRPRVTPRQAEPVAVQPAALVRIVAVAPQRAHEVEVAGRDLRRKPNVEVRVSRADEWNEPRPA